MSPAPKRHSSCSQADQIRIAEASLSRLLEWVARADTKASFIIGLNTAMIGVLAATATAPKGWNAALGVLVCTAIAFHSLGFYFIYAATFPRLSGPFKSLIFFGPVAKLPYEVFETHFLSQTPTGYLNDLLRQCHQNALIGDTKYRCVKAAYHSLALAAVPWALTIYNFRISKP